MTHEAEFKAQARKLVELLAHRAHPVRYQDALDITAQLMGAKGWKVLAAKLKQLDAKPTTAAPTVTAAQLPTAEPLAQGAVNDGWRAGAYLVEASEPHDPQDDLLWADLTLRGETEHFHSCAASLVRADAREERLSYCRRIAEMLHRAAPRPEEVDPETLQSVFTDAAMSSTGEQLLALQHTLERAVRHATKVDEAPELRYHLVSLTSDIVVDDYNDGEGESTGCGYADERIGRTFDTLQDVVEFLASHYGLSEGLEDYDVQGNRLSASRQVADHSEAQNGGWMEPTEEELQAWRAGTLKLYCENYVIRMLRVR